MQIINKHIHTRIDRPAMVNVLYDEEKKENEEEC